MLESTDEMRASLIVHLDLKVLELGNRFLENRTDPTQPRLSGTLLFIPNPLENVSPEWVILDRRRRKLLRIPNGLWNHMLIPNGLKKLSHRPKLFVRENLLQRGLCQEHLILFVVRVWPVYNGRVFCLQMLYDLTSYPRDALVVLIELDSVAPARVVFRPADNHIDGYVRALPGCKAPNFGYASPVVDSLLKSILCEILQEAEGIEQI